MSWIETLKKFFPTIVLGIFKPKSLLSIWRQENHESVLSPTRLVAIETFLVALIFYAQKRIGVYKDKWGAFEKFAESESSKLIFDAVSSILPATAVWISIVIIAFFVGFNWKKALRIAAISNPIGLILTPIFVVFSLTRSDVFHSSLVNLSQGLIGIIYLTIGFKEEKKCSTIKAIGFSFAGMVLTIIVMTLFISLWGFFVYTLN